MTPGAATALVRVSVRPQPPSPPVRGGIGEDGGRGQAGTGDPGVPDTLAGERRFQGIETGLSYGRSPGARARVYESKLTLSVTEDFWTRAGDRSFLRVARSLERKVRGP